MSKSPSTKRGAKKRKSYVRWMMKSGDYLLCLTYEESELCRLRCGIKCDNKHRFKGNPKKTLVKVRITEVN